MKESKRVRERERACSPNMATLNLATPRRQVIVVDIKRAPLVAPVLPVASAIKLPFCFVIAVCRSTDHLTKERWHALRTVVGTC